MPIAFFEGWDSTPQAITQKALANNFNLEERERREEALLNRDFYYGKQEQSLVLINEDVDPIVVNLMKPVLNKRTNLLYRRPLRRTFKGPARSVRFLERVYEENNMDAQLRQADLLSELTGSALIHPILTDSNETGTAFRIYDGSQFSVTDNIGDPSAAEAISLIRIVDRLVDDAKNSEQMPQVERVILQQIWTEGAVVTYEGSEILQSEENPLGFLPFVNFKGEEVHDQYIGFPTATLVRQLNAQINQLMTLLGYTIKMQSGTPIALSGFNAGEQVVIHPGRAINLPAGAEARVLQLQPKIRDTLEAIKHMEDLLYTTSSVPRVTVEGENEGGNTHISAQQLLVRWHPLLEVFHEKRFRYKRYEVELANMVLAVNDLPYVDDVEIEWAEEELLPLSPETETLERDIKLNLRTPVDELMRRNDFLTESQALAQWLENIEINSMTSNNTEEEEPSEEGEAPPEEETPAE